MPHDPAYRVSDDWIMLGGHTVRQAANLLAAPGLAAEADAVRAMSKAGFHAIAPAHRDATAARLQTRRAQEWEDLLSAAHVPDARIRRIEEALAEPQAASPAAVQSCGAPLAPDGPDRQPVAAFSLAHGGPRIAGPPPGFGARRDFHGQRSSRGSTPG